MTQVTVRMLLFSLAPLLFAAIHVEIAKPRTRVARIEAYLVYLFVLGVGAAGVSGFVGHIFLADDVARSIGWSEGSPFQQEMGFSNLALGVLGFVAAHRRDGFREATVIAATVVGLGATLVHLMDVVAQGNLAPGNTMQNIGNVLKPLLLVPLLYSSRRQQPSSTAIDEGWSATLIGAALAVTAVLGTGLALGYATGAVVPIAAIAVFVAVAIVVRSGRLEPRGT
jgi:hypothetical protein